MSRKCLAVGVFALAAASVQADVVDFTIYENASGGDVSGLLMTVELIDAGSSIDFVFRNQSVTQSVITAVYFEGTDSIDSLLLGGAVQAASSGVGFEDGATPHNPAQLPLWAGGAWNQTLYAAGALSPSSQKGVNEIGDEWVSIRFDYGAGADFHAVADALTSDPAQFRIAMHIQSVGEGEFSVWGTTVPAPATLALLPLGAPFVARRRR